MHTATARRCDICAQVIPRGTPYRVGHTTPDLHDAAFADADPAARARCGGLPLDDAMRVRVCDIRTAVIPRDVAYRIGHTTPDAIDDAFADAEPEAHVAATTTAEGLVRIEVCQVCAAAVGLALLPDEGVDAPQ